jgi:hypothetical protein
MFESYCADIESLLREGLARQALRRGLALPNICSALEHAQMVGSRERYATWCAAWVNLDPLSVAAKPLTGERLYKAHLRASRTKRSGARIDPAAVALKGLRMSRGTRRTRSLGRTRIWEPVGVIASFEVRLSEAFVASARRWYAERGATDPLVQRNLGRLRISQ